MSGIIHYMKVLTSIIFFVGITGAIAQETRFVGRPQDEQRKIVEKAIKLKQGDSYQTVTNALGKPDLEKGSGSDGKGPTGRLLHYSLFRGASTRVDCEEGFNTRFVQVILDIKTDRVHLVYIHAVLQ